MLKKWVAIVLAISLALCLMPAASAAGTEAQDAADALYALGLFRGTGTDAEGAPVFALSSPLTRGEAVTMLVRLLGQEEEALGGTWETPFTDLADWMAPYVGLTYESGLTTGTGETSFEGDAPVTAAQFLTFVLRALGYDDSAGDFSWDRAWELSDALGITDGTYGPGNHDAFVRGDAALVSLAALSQRCKGADTTLLEQIELRNPPRADFGALMDEAAAAHQALLENGAPFAGFENYLVNDPEATGLVSPAEAAALTALGSQGPDVLSPEEAGADIDLLFRAIRSAYGAYYYFGPENFAAAEAELMSWLEGHSAVPRAELAAKLAEALDFVRDAHFYVGDIGIREALFREEYFYCPGQSWARDDGGYYKYVAGEKWYLDHFADSRVEMEEMLLRSGELCWAPVLFCRPGDVAASSVTLRNDAGETLTEPLTWTESQAYSQSVREPDYHLLRENGIVYISERNFDMSYEALLNGFVAAAATVRDASLIIFDIRANGGGADHFGRNWVEAFCGAEPQLTEAWSTRVSTLRNAALARDGLQPESGISGFYYHVGSTAGRLLPNDVPILVLVDDMCGSSGESMLNFLRAMDNVLVVGSNSSGYQLCGNVMGFRLPNSGIPFDFGASLQFSFTAENVDFRGYAPDVWCDPAWALDAALNLVLRYGLTDLDTWQAFRSAVYAVA